ncbi:hypothetical protein [Nitrospirillum sp. BR 11163]|uniref:hypothetical protein n=1 Tax=Nitrospirillum sp. BR 11163 TaxID=3104323 RepID=UPI002AFE9D6F|nr:hypothetical protein [Nitrospirillum sp. BR 11163]MEA1675742.1 hypothetical protein [Nitrospirillum sp. BR 11163]
MFHSGHEEAMVGKARKAKAGDQGPQNQMDLFGAPVTVAVNPPTPLRPRPPVEPAPADLDDAGLLARLPDAPLSKALPLIAEVGRRRLAGAVPLLGLRLKRLAGYGLSGREPVAVLEALAAIGGPQATAIVAGLLGGVGLAGPVEVAALGAAVRLEVALDRKALLRLLGTADAAARAAACRCVRQAEFPVIDALERLRADPDRAVATGAVCALGRLGRPTVRADLAQLVTAAPTRETVAALASVMDHVGVDADSLVALRRAARHTDLRETVLEALDGFDDVQATALAVKLRQQTTRADAA